MATKVKKTHYEVTIVEQNSLKRMTLIQTFTKNGYSKWPKTGLIAVKKQRELQLRRKNIRIILLWDVK